MILSELLAAEVYGEERLGHVTDVRFVLEGDSTDQAMPPARLHGLIVSPHTKSSPLGFERTEIRSPWPIAQLEHWLHRDSFLVLWADIAAILPERIQLRPGFTRYSARLIKSAVPEPHFE
jgi:hypothetical protein